MVLCCGGLNAQPDLVALRVVLRAVFDERRDDGGEDAVSRPFAGS